MSLPKPPGTSIALPLTLIGASYRDTYPEFPLFSGVGQEWPLSREPCVVSSRAMDLDSGIGLGFASFTEGIPMPAAPAIPGQGRPEPPVELSDAERQIWVACVESRPLNYFDKGTWPLLEAYCMHAVLARDLAADLRKH